MPKGKQRKLIKETFFYKEILKLVSNVSCLRSYAVAELLEVQKHKQKCPERMQAKTKLKLKSK